MNGSTSTSAPVDTSQFPQTPAQLQHILTALLQGNSADIAHATTVINAWQKQEPVNSVSGLMQQLSDTSSPVPIRQAGAVLLRRRILQQWSKLSNDMKQSIKQVLLQRLEHENDRLVRQSVAALISNIAKLTVPKNEWNELITLLMSWCNSAEAHQRELSMMLFRALAENIGQSLKPHFKQLQQIFAAGLADATSDKVRVEAVYAIGVLVDLIDNESALTSFKQVVQPLIQVVHQHIQTGNEDLIAAGFDVLDTLAQSPANILDTAFTQLLPLMIDVSCNNELDLNVRDKAASLAAAMIEAKPKSIVKQKFVEPLLNASVTLLTVPDSTCFDPTDDVTAQRLGVEILDAMTLYIPRKYVYQPCLAAASRLLQSQSVHERKAGLIVLSVMAEGCSDSLRATMSEIVPAICQSLQDQSPLVRISACLALTQFAEHLQPEILQYHAVIIPRTLQTLDQANESMQVKEKSITVLEVMLESMSEDVVPYLEAVMQRLVVLLQQPDVQPTFRQSAINAITAVAQAAEAQFTPFFHVTSQLLLPYMQLNGDETLRLRSRATVCMGQMALAVGKQQFAPLLTQTMSLVMNGMTLDYFELREASYVFFSLVLQSLEDQSECMPYITTLMPLILATGFSDDGVVFQNKRGSALNQDEGNGDDDDDEINSDGNSDEEHEDGANVNISIRSGALDEKVGALQCLATCISIAADRFSPYMDKTMQLIDELIEYPHAYVRQAVMQVCIDIFKLLHKLYPVQVVKGQIATLPPQAKPIIESIVSHLYVRLEEDEDKESVAVACDALGEALQLFGMAAVKSSGLEKLYKRIQTLLQEKAVCQQNEIDENPDIVADHDSILIDSVTDLIAYTAQAVGPQFDKPFKSMFSMLMKFFEPSRQSADRSMAIGCMAEVAAELGPSLSNYLPKLMPATIAGIQDNAVIVRRNAAYAYGILAASGQTGVISTFTDTLPKLRHMIDHKAINKVVHQADSDEVEDKSLLTSEINGAKDNAVSALCKMMCTCVRSNDNNVQQLMPYNTLIPFILNELPLTDDLQEAKYVYGAVVQMYHSKPDLMQQYTPQVFAVWSQVLGDAEVDTSVQAEMTTFIKQLAQTIGQQQTEQIVNTHVPQEHKERFVKFLTS